MQAGSLNTRAAIQKRTGGVDDWGTPLPEGWAPHAFVWANVRHLNGSETIRAGAVISEGQASIRIRFREDVDAGMRVVVDARTYSIAAVLPDLVGREHVDLLAELVT